MSNEAKIFLAVIAGTLLLIFGAAFLLGRGTRQQGLTGGVQTVASEILVRGDSWKIGSESAKVTVVEFSDFQCPACKSAEMVVKSVIAKYGDNLRFVYRHYPLPSHEFAFAAAVAAEVAGKQGKFWEYHDKLFERQPEFSEGKLVGYARDLGLNIDVFKKDKDTDELRQKVLNDQADGNRAGINATPTFFVNGTKVDNYSSLDQVVSGELSK